MARDAPPAGEQCRFAAPGAASVHVSQPGRVACGYERTMAVSSHIRRNRPCGGSICSRPSSVEDQ